MNIYEAKGNQSFLGSLKFTFSSCPQKQGASVQNPLTSSARRNLEVSYGVTINNYIILCLVHVYMSAHTLFTLSHPNSWGLYARSSPTHSLLEQLPTICGGALLLPPPGHFPITRLTNASHLTLKTGCTSAKIF